MKEDLLKIIDANLNRTREGLRVCEDITRFAMLDKGIASSLKIIRHSATKAALSSKTPWLKKLVMARDTKSDPLKFTDVKKRKGTAVTDLFLSNIQRAKESLRVLEECSRILDEGMSRRYRKLRFNVYDIEKKALGLFERT